MVSMQLSEAGQRTWESNPQSSVSSSLWAWLRFAEGIYSWTNQGMLREPLLSTRWPHRSTNSNEAWGRHRQFQLYQRVLSGGFLHKRYQKRKMYYDHPQYIYNTKMASTGGNENNSRKRVDWRAKTTETNQAVAGEWGFLPSFW